MAKALILIIDQSRATRAMYADYFRYHGYDVAEAVDSAEGVLLSRTLKPDLVVTELSADLEWVQAIRVMRSNGTARETAIIACSTLIESNWPQAPGGVEVDRALPKPMSPRSLLWEVQQLLGHAPAEPAVAGGAGF
jgi:DNA-binding response OmpR family regulator